jgi:ATP-dependent protease HslVU (ClpYQ) peptidase subunit
MKRNVVLSAMLGIFLCLMSVDAARATAVIGLVHEGTVYLGADSAGMNTSDLSLTIRTDKKVFANGQFIMGFTGPFRIGQLLHYKLRVSEQKSDQDLNEFMVITFIDAVRDCLKDGGFASKTNNSLYGQESGGRFLVGYGGRLFKIDYDYQVGESADGYCAIGCGMHFCLGSLYTTANTGLSPEERIIKALEAAAKFSAGVQGPFHVIKLAPDGTISWVKE